MPTINTDMITALFDTFRAYATIPHLYEAAPESVVDTPALVLTDVQGVSVANAYNGGRERTLTYTLMLLVAERRQLDEAITLLRAHQDVVEILETHDEWDGNGWYARTEQIQWQEGVIEYAGTPYAAVTYTLTVEQHSTVAIAPCR